MSKITAYEYLENEMKGAIQKAQSLPLQNDRQLFADHADMIYSRMLHMTPEEAGRVMFEEESKEVPEEAAIASLLSTSEKLAMAESVLARVKLALSENLVPRELRGTGQSAAYRIGRIGGLIRIWEIVR